MKNLHRIDDSLWNLGNKKIPKKLVVPELEKMNKTQIQLENEETAKINMEREESKKLLNNEFIELVNKMNLDNELNVEKLNSIFDDKVEKNQLNFDKIFEKTNLIPILNHILDEKLNKIKENEKIEEEEENTEENQEKEINEDGEEENEEDSEENEKLYKKDIENIYLNFDNLEFIFEKLNKFDRFYTYLESEINKFLESKTAKDNLTNENFNNLEIDNKQQYDNDKNDLNKKVKQHKKNHKNKQKGKQMNEGDLIDIGALTRNTEYEENKDLDEKQIIDLKDDFIKTNLKLEINFDTLKYIKNQLGKLNEFVLFILILTKSKSEINYMSDPKFLNLLAIYKNLFEESAKKKEMNENNQKYLVKEKNEKDENEEDDGLSKITPEEMDENINLVFFSVLKLIVFPKKDEIFPLDPGKLLKDFLKPMGSELDILIDFRFSSFKKINNYLKSLSKNDELIVFTKPKGLQNDFILSVNWQSDKLKNFVPPVTKVKFLSYKITTKDDERDNVILSKDEKIELMQMFKPNGIINDIFKRYDKTYERYFC